MGENTFRYRSESDAGTYWRRRFLALSIGLAVLALISWGLSSALSVSSAGGRAVTRHGQPVHGPAPVAGASASPAGSGQHASGKPGPNSPAHASVGGSASATGARSGRTSSPRPRPSGKSSYPGIRPTFCARRDIVLSLSSSQASFGPQQQPAFSLTIVSTQQAECSFNVGPGFLALVVKEGPVRVWSSADCVRGTGSLVSALRRGVPTVLPVTWNRRTSSPGCSGPVNRIPAGVYTAYATDDSIISAPVTFHLG